MSLKCEIRILRIKLPLEGSIPDDEIFFRKISRSVGYLIDTSSKFDYHREIYIKKYTKKI
jgi:hypothetical protein